MSGLNVKPIKSFLPVSSLRDVVKEAIDKKVSDDLRRTKSKSYSSKIRLLSKSLVRDYGNLGFVVTMSDNLINFIGNFKQDNSKYQSFLNKIKSFIPAIITTSEIISKAKMYYKIMNSEDNIASTNDSHNDKIKKYLGIDDMDKDSIDLFSESFPVGLEIAKWLFMSPKTEKFKIIKCMYYKDGTECHKFDCDISEKVAVIEYDGCRLCLIFNIESGTKSISLGDVVFYYGSNNDAVVTYSSLQTLVGIITKEFLNSLDTKNNTIILSPSGISTGKRLNPVEKSIQIEADNMSKEICDILKKGKKRGYVFVGIPGTGKSTLIHIIESITKEYPIVYITTECFNDSYYVSDAFKIISYIQPCIVVMEDMDSYNIKNKNRELGELLECIDDVDNKLNIVLLATVNDTSNVHYSLINRPGRFDEVIVINTPKNKNEIYSVMKCRYDKNMEIINKNKHEDNSTISDEKKEFLHANKISGRVYRSIIKNKYTHADICEIIEKSLFKSSGITNKILLESIENLKKSKKAIKDFNFGGNDPNKLTNK